MSHIIISAGTLYTRNPGSGTLASSSLPTGISVDTTRRPSFAKYRRKTVIVGEFNPALVWHDDTGAFYKAGLTAPASAITVAAGGGASTIDAASVKAYVTYRHKSGTTILAESNPSPVSNEVVISLTGVSYTGLPTTSTDARTTHVAVYRSDDGALPQFDVEVTLGTATASSTTATLSLGVALPQTSSGALDTLARGVPPYTRFNAVYHDRMWYAGDPTYPQRVWYSRLGEPEAVRANGTDGTGGFYIDTRHSDAVTGIAAGSDQLIVFTATRMYAIQGWSDGSDGTGEADLTMVEITSKVGCISHWSIVDVGSPSGGTLLMWAAQDGVWSYDGSLPRYMMADLRSYWRDAYVADKTNYEDCFGGFDHYWQTYKLGIPAASSTFYYVGHMLPLQEGRLQPDWVFDRKLRRERTMGNLVNTSTGRLFEFFTGADDGYLRQENQDSTGADDDKNKVSKVRHKHYYLGGLSGGINHGNKWRAVDIYAKHESQALSVFVNAGDEGAGDAVTPQKTLTLAAGAVATINPKGREYCPLDGVSGAGVSIEMDCTNGVGVELNGFGVTYEPVGSNTRLKVT